MSLATHKRLLITSALPYANGAAHLGHLAGAYLPADIYARYNRLQGRDVVFICGSDEHGVPITIRARKEGLDPQAIVDRYHRLLEETFAAFGMSFDHYGRTSSALHHETTKDFFRVLSHRGAFVLKTEEQLFDVEAAMFLADRFVRGTCPSCAYVDAYGDQCEKCGRALSPQELLDPRSAITNSKPELRSTTHWYLTLSKQQEWLAEWLASRTDWKTHVISQAESWLKEGLSDRSMTRDLAWGVSIPPDIASEAGVDASGKVFYVWFDAPIGYISSTREWALRTQEPDRWKTYWQSNDTKLVQFIGKDNIVFHTIIFPAMLHLHGDYVLPDNVPANEFLNLGGEKFSKSRELGLLAHEVLQKFPVDCVRYALIGVMPETKDSDFSFKELQARVNGELADTLGNLLSRSIKFAEQFYDGRVPAAGPLSAQDTGMLQALSSAPSEIAELIERYRFREACSAMMGLARRANKYINDTQPWALRESAPVSAQTSINVALQVCAGLSILCEPFIPTSALKMRRMLLLEGVRSSERASGEHGLGWQDAGRPLLAPGQKLGAPEILFHKIDDAEIEAAMTTESLPTTASVSVRYQPIADLISIDDFAKIDLRIGKVIVVEPIPKYKKLFRCTVDLGFEHRQIVAGVAESVSASTLLGSNALIVANLPTKKIAGVDSQGMMLFARNQSNEFVPIVATVEPGSTVG